MTIIMNLINLLKYEICNSIILWLKANYVVQLNFENNNYNLSSIVFMYSVS